MSGPELIAFHGSFLTSQTGLRAELVSETFTGETLEPQEG